MKPYAVECEHGIISALARGAKRMRGIWMLRWYIIYDSDGNIVAEKAKRREA